jgi:DNA-binding MurR/RpiR family transcriptional regulator
MAESRSDEIGTWTSSSDILARIQAILPSLAPSQHRVGVATLEDPALTAGSTISELAERCETSETSVLRFCRTLGFEGYPGFRIAVAAAVGEEAASGRAYVSGEILEVDSVETVVQKVSSADALAVLDTARHVDSGSVETVAKSIAAAGRVEEFGAGASSIVAADLHQKLTRIGIRSSAWLDPHGALMGASQLQSGDVAIGISHGGETTLTIRFLETARSTGAITVALTNVPRSAVAGAADIVIATSVRETVQRSAAMASRIAQLSIVDILFTLVARTDAARTQQLVNATHESVKGL